MIELDQVRSAVVVPPIVVISAPRTTSTPSPQYPPRLAVPVESAPCSYPQTMLYSVA